MSPELTATFIRAIPDYVCAVVFFICAGALCIGFSS
jgi:hypothetical protein